MEISSLFFLFPILLYISFLSQFIIQPEDAGEGTLHEQILRWFHDSPSPEAHYSIHRVAHIGHILFDKKIGQWYEPTLTCLIFQVIIYLFIYYMSVSPISVPDIC